MPVRIYRYHREARPYPDATRLAAMIRAIALLCALVALATHRDAASCATSSPASGARTTSAPTTAETPSPLADEIVDLAGGALRARLPRGPIVPNVTEIIPAPGVLVPSVQVVTRENGNLRIVAVDTGERAGDGPFAELAKASERPLRCLQPTSEISPSIDAVIEGGLEIVGFTSAAACPATRPTDGRLWVRAPDASVYTITFTCLDEGCMPDRTTLLATFVSTVRAGTPTTAPAGARAFGPSDALRVTVDVPEGYFVRDTEGAHARTYEIFRRQPMGAAWESASFTFLFTPSPNSLADDYGRADARMRTVRGTLAGKRVRFLEIRYGERTERFARTSLEGADMDVGIVGASPEALAELRAIVARAHVPAATR